MVFLKPDKTYEINGITVKDYFLTQHNVNKIALPAKRTKDLIGITIHNTENITPAKGTTKSEQYTRATVYGNMNDVRVHYYVDEVEAWHNLPDDWIGWHAADGNGNGNMATIAIEVIGNSAKAEDNAAKLVAGLMAKYNLDTNNLYTHVHWMNIKHGATGTREYLNTLKNRTKNCPAYILPHWGNFENSVANYLAEIKKNDDLNKQQPASTNTDKDKPTTIYRIQVGAYSIRENAENFLAKVKAAGFDNAFIATIEQNDKSNIYRIQVGAYSVRTNAESFLEKVKCAGFGNAFIVTVKQGDVSSEKSIKVGSTVRVRNGAKTYTGGSLAAFVYNRDHKVSEIKGDRAVITYGNSVVAAVNIKDLILI